MTKPKLLLHTCCAPCFTSVFEELSKDYAVTIFWFNPNIYPIQEYELRLKELKRYAQIIDCKIIIKQSDTKKWDNVITGLEDELEGGERCKRCIRYRFDETARYAKKEHYDLFATTLTVSPHKDADLINEIGEEIMKKYDISFLKADFKKRNGYLRSIEICKEYDIYRQKYCGCKFS